MKNLFSILLALVLLLTLGLVTAVPAAVAADEGTNYSPFGTVLYIYGSDGENKIKWWFLGKGLDKDQWDGYQVTIVNSQWPDFNGQFYLKWTGAKEMFTLWRDAAFTDQVITANTGLIGDWDNPAAYAIDGWVVFNPAIDSVGDPRETVGNMSHMWYDHSGGSGGGNLEVKFQIGLEHGFLHGYFLELVDCGWPDLNGTWYLKCVGDAGSTNVDFYELYADPDFTQLGIPEDPGKFVPYGGEYGYLFGPRGRFVGIASIIMSPRSVAGDVSKGITFTVVNPVEEVYIDEFELTVPKDGDAPQYIVSEVVTPPGWIMSYATDMASGRVSKLTWTKSNSGITYGASQAFVFSATTPSATGDYGWVYKITNADSATQEGSVVQRVDADAPLISGVTVEPAPNAAGFISQASADISANITDDHLNTDSLKVFYSTDEGAVWDPEAMSSVGGDAYSATLSSLPEGELWYYIYAADTVDPNEATNPVGAPLEYHSFIVDTIAPVAPVADNLTVNQNPPGTVDSVEGAAGAVEGNALVEVWDGSDPSSANLTGSNTAASDGSFAAIGIGDNLHAEVWVTAKDAADNRGEATMVENDMEDPTIDDVDWAVGGETPGVLALNDVIVVTMRGEAGCTGTFNIGIIATAVAMTETEEGVYSGNYTVQSGDDGVSIVYGLLIDAAGNTSEVYEDGTVNIVTDETPPVIGVPSVEYPVGAFSARVGDPVVISVEVTDPIEPATGVDSVSANATSIGLSSSESMARVDGTDVWAVELTIGDVDLGAKTLTITATDGAGLDADPVEVEVEVTLRLTGYNIELDEGWNLMSLPLIPENTAIVPMLASISEDVTIVWGYDPINIPGDHWALYKPGVVEDDLTEMVGGMGYWLSLTTEEATLTVTGLEMPEPPTAPPAYDVASGWNLIGVKAVDPIHYEDYLVSIENNYSVIWGYNPETGYFNVYPIGGLESDELNPGQGCWLWMKVAGIIVPPQ